MKYEEACKLMTLEEKAALWTVQAQNWCRKPLSKEQELEILGLVKKGGTKHDIVDYLEKL